MALCATYKPCLTVQLVRCGEPCRAELSWILGLLLLRVLYTCLYYPSLPPALLWDHWQTSEGFVAVHHLNLLAERAQLYTTATHLSNAQPVGDLCLLDVQCTTIALIGRGFCHHQPGLVGLVARWMLMMWQGRPRGLCLLRTINHAGGVCPEGVCLRSMRGVACCAEIRFFCILCRLTYPQRL